MHMIYFLLLIIIPCFSQDYCNALVQMGPSCMFYFINSAGGCNNSTFKQCEYRQKSLGRIQQVTFKQLETCLMVCCKSRDGIFLSTIVEVCNEPLNVQQQQSPVKYYLAALVVFLLVLSIISIRFMKWKECLQECQKKRRQQAIQKMSHNQPQLNEEQVASKQNINSSMKQSFNCWICFEKGVTVRLECQHTYHRKCIAKNIDEKKPLKCCGKPKQKLELFCENCFESMGQRTLISITIPFQSLPSICEQC